MKRRSSANINGIANGSNFSLRNKSADHYKRVILHLDLDCFYAQVEHNRLQIPLSYPLAVQQWNGLIAVNYAARDAGIKRHTSVSEALIKCPQLRLVHVPTYSLSSISQSGDGDEIVALPKYSDAEDLIPAFRADGSRIPPNPPDPATNKACLEPYRQASLQIFRLIRAWASELSPGIVVEKGGLDEAFIDITEEIEQQLIDQFDQKYTMIRDELDEFESPELDEEARQDLLETLKLYETAWMDEANLNYEGLGELAIEKDANLLEESSEDLVEHLRMRLGTLRIWKGAQLAKILRSRLRGELNFIASIGIASNKMLAKLTSAIYKPDKQTRLEPAAIKTFMKRVPFEKIRMMGGKMGQSVLLGVNSNKFNDYDEEEEGYDDEEEVGNYYEVEDALNPTENAPAKVMAADLWPLSISELTDRVGDRQTAAWIHQLIRGQDSSPVTPRSLTKSFMSAKSFRPSVRDWPELHDWVVVLVAELWSRVVEEREASARWPSTITIHFKSSSPALRKKSNSSSQFSTALTRSSDFPSFFAENTRPQFLAATFKLFNLPEMFPITRLAISVTNFKALDSEGKARPSRVDQFFPADNKEIAMPESLERFFKTKTGNKMKLENQNTNQTAVINPKYKKNNNPNSASVLDLLRQASTKEPSSSPNQYPKDDSLSKSFDKTPPVKGIAKYFKTKDSPEFRCNERACSFRCPKNDSKTIQEHTDYHLAMDLMNKQ